MRCTRLLLFAALSLVFLTLPLRTSAQLIQTAAGNGVYGFGGDNGPAINSAINYDTGVAVDSRGNPILPTGLHQGLSSQFLDGL